MWEECYVVLNLVSPVNTLTFLIEVSGLLAGLSREAVRCAGIGWGRHGCWTAKEQNVHMRNVKKMI